MGITPFTPFTPCMCTCGSVALMEALNLDPQIDWARRADGAEHTLVQGEHFTREAYKVRRAAGMWARRNGLRAVTRIVWGEPGSGSDRLIVAFVEMEGKV